MIKVLEKYSNTNQFNYTTEDNLEINCNVPDSISGIYLVFEVNGIDKELIMVGSSGTVQNDGQLKEKRGGLFDKIVNGSQFTKSARKYSWPTQMKKEEISLLEVQWFETFNSEVQDIPTFVEASVLQEFLNENQRLPRWNVAF